MGFIRLFFGLVLYAAVGSAVIGLGMLVDKETVAEKDEPYACVAVIVWPVVLLYLLCISIIRAITKHGNVRPRNRKV